MSVGQNVKKYRVALGLSQGRLSDLSSVPQTTISTIEHGATPNARIANELAKALKVSIEDLLAEEVFK
ncbi:helix-turn-helix transcriptional regulator [Secundilactobacillus kimchicus]|uniref:helix-turn-helix transcriptional regulator n=1 Tax=Secundilactobacillus kimchicus TaxID=528209 RepID=UPI0024A9F34B|nr:helix-turn-helix transcriptional regulator [Secundilactobacillus kimchicus]